MSSETDQEAPRGRVTYVFAGKVIPERALIDAGPIHFEVHGSEDVSEGTLSVQIIKSQVIAQFFASAPVVNVFTLRNAVRDTARVLTDAVGYYVGYGYDLEITQVVCSELGYSHVFGIDVPALEGVCAAAGVSLDNVFKVLTQPDGSFFRQALADVREAVRSPADTGFFCYRSIESLQNQYAQRNGLAPRESETWDRFRDHYSLSREMLMGVKSWADAARHGQVSTVTPVTDAARANLFKDTWEVINKYIRVETSE